MYARHFTLMRADGEALRDSVGSLQCERVDLVVASFLASATCTLQHQVLGAGFVLPVGFRGPVFYVEGIV